MSIVERIQSEISKKGISIKALEKEIGLGNGTIKRWDNSSPQCNKIQLVANYLHVSLEWLITGKESNNLTKEETELIIAYRNAEPAIQHATKKLLDIPEQTVEGLQEEKSSISRTG